MLLGTDPNTYVPLHLIIGGLEFNSFQTGLVAHAGGGQANATPITTELATVATVANAGDSVVLPPTLGPTGGPAQGGLSVTVINAGANPMQVYGAGVDTINGVAAATGVSQMPNSAVTYVSTDQGKWLAPDIGTGYAGSLPTVSAKDGLVAHAGGGQGSATPMPSSINRFITVATIGDSGLLPASAAGLDITVINNAANQMNVFPQTGDAINALGANNAFAVPGGKTANFYCCTAGQWHTILSA